MRRRVSIRAAAAADLREAREWYEGRRPGLGDEFLLAIPDSMVRLEEAACSLPLYYRGFRRLLIDRFPYKIFFRIEGDAVIVFRILHAARDHASELRGDDQTAGRGAGPGRGFHPARLVEPARLLQ